MYIFILRYEYVCITYMMYKCIEVSSTVHSLSVFCQDQFLLVPRTKVGIWDWEEHVYLFTAVASPNLVATAGFPRKLDSFGLSTRKCFVSRNYC